MNDESEDDGALRAQFAALRKVDERAAPAFMLKRPHARPALFVPAWSAASLLLAFAVGAAWLAVRREAPDEALLPAGFHGVSLRTPTDFLLETPGRDLLRSVPAPQSEPDFTYEVDET